MQEREACALLKARFEAAGYHIEDNVRFDELGVRFEIDGFDHDRRVGYEYLTDEAGDGWDVDAEVVAKLAAAQARGELFVLIVDEHDASTADALDARITAFLDELPALPHAAAAKQPAAKASKDAKPDKAEKPAKAEKSTKAEKPAKAEKSPKADKADAAAPKKRKK